MVRNQNDQSKRNLAPDVEKGERELWRRFGSVMRMLLVGVKILDNFWTRSSVVKGSTDTRDKAFKTFRVFEGSRSHRDIYVHAEKSTLPNASVRQPIFIRPTRLSPLFYDDFKFIFICLTLVNIYVCKSSAWFRKFLSFPLFVTFE